MGLKNDKYQISIPLRLDDQEYRQHIIQRAKVDMMKHIADITWSGQYFCIRFDEEFIEYEENFWAPKFGADEYRLSIRISEVMEEPIYIPTYEDMSVRVLSHSATQEIKRRIKYTIKRKLNDWYPGRF